MKNVFVIVAVALMSATSLFAQDAKELAKQQQELNAINMKLLNAKPTKDAKKQAKSLEKEGWKVPAGEKPIAKQITDAQLLGEELIDLSVKRFVIHTAQSVAGTYNAAVANARANAQLEIGTMLETQIAAAMEAKLDNQQTSAITANTVEKFHQRAKSVMDASLTNTRTVLAIYRVNKQNNYEVQLRVAYDKKDLSARLKQNMMKELELEGDKDLSGIIDAVLMSGM